jgi:predicted O-methyltransferase YrrM
MNGLNKSPSLQDLLDISNNLDSVDRPQWLLPLPESTSVVGMPMYKFLYAVSKVIQPILAVELGTWLGVGALHMSAASPKGLTISVDIDPKVSERVDIVRQQGLNLDYYKGKTLDPATLNHIGFHSEANSGIDLLFIDAEHSYGMVKSEYETYKNYMRKGGVILFDDLYLNEGMTRFWNELTAPKIELPAVHFVGFGAIIA